MSGHLSTPKAHLEPEYVLGVYGQPYYAADIPSVDRRILELLARIADKGQRFPKLAATWSKDIDLLLERRAWLEWVNLEVAAC